MSSLLSTLRVLLPQVLAWAEEKQAEILAAGRPLTKAELSDARLAGVLHPEKIRLLQVEELPQPNIPDAVFVAKQVGLFSPQSSSLSLGYGISLRHDAWEDRYIKLHEFVHVGQFEKLGLEAFLGSYLRECIEPGYPFGRMEQEARRIARATCGLPL